MLTRQENDQILRVGLCYGMQAEELAQAFHVAVDDFTDACGKLGQRPERPASGRMLLRVPPGLHADAIHAAELAGKSLNQWATDALQRATR